jgi:hypothetical protein
MNKKLILVLLVVMAGAVATVFALDHRSDAPAQIAAPTEQVSTETPAHCDPSNCTPEQASQCPYANKAAAETSASADNACPATKDCPPSKCNAASKTATL